MQEKRKLNIDRMDYTEVSLNCVSTVVDNFSRFLVFILISLPPSFQAALLLTNLTSQPMPTTLAEAVHDKWMGPVIKNEDTGVSSFHL